MRQRVVIALALCAEPQLVIATGRAIAEMPGRPGWSMLAALAAGRVCAFDEARFDLLVRPGPRLADGADAIAACLAALPPPR
jgi:iron complex transport system substrate-binding protein